MSDETPLAGAGLIRRQDARVFFAPLLDAARYFGAVVDRAEGSVVPPEALRPLDPELFIEAFELVTERLGSMDKVAAYSAMRDWLQPFETLQLYFAYAQRAAEHATPNAAHRLATALAAVHRELARLGIVYLAPEGDMPGGWTVLGDEIKLPSAPDYPPEF